MLEVLREPDAAGLQEKIVDPAHAAMVRAAVDDFVRTWHHACYVRARDTPFPTWHRYTEIQSPAEIQPRYSRDTAVMLPTYKRD